MSVVIKTGKDRIRTTIDALKEAKLDNYISKDKPILIKPNFINDTHSNLGMTTDVEVVMAIVFYLQEFLAKEKLSNEVIIAEGNGCGSVERGYEVNNYTKIDGVKLVNLDKTEMVMTPILNEQMLFSKYAFDYQVISVAKLKPHSMAGMTCTLKNLMGFVYPKGNMHSNLHNKIVALGKIIKPVFGVVDGFIANAVAETVNAPVELDTVIVGNNCFDVDLVCSKILGLDYVGSVEISKREGLCTKDLSIVGDIDTVRETYLKLKNK